MIRIDVIKKNMFSPCAGMSNDRSKKNLAIENILHSRTRGIGNGP